ncbi:DUF1090 domain-containing protein [Photobacterium halotolerans]|uniref:DUF1090 domain-containing protein n=1 Tax=Photobacterium halotolerans TaxID=265726 RepID=UPI000420F2A4|nr:DUF1090 domain-containing protein [Photobacterium halotolerans]
MFNKLIYIGIYITIPTFSSLAQEPLQLCQAKEYEIKQQIEYAKNYGDDYRLTGLEKALSEVQNHCTNEVLLEERRAKIREKVQKVTERSQELQEARKSGRLDKIEKKAKKLQEAEEELIEEKMS